MAKLLKLRRGNTSQHGSFTGAEGEVTVDTDKETLVVHDGSTAGGHPVAAEDMANVSSASIAGRLANDSIATSKIAAGALPSDVTVASANIVDGTIVNADVNASAAIAGTKISPNFGSQSVVTTGNVTLSDSSGGGNNRAVFGASGDLQVWHDGSNSYIADEGTGALRILGSAIQLKNVANNEIGLEFTENGAVDLYYDNSKKLQTQSGGVRVFGDLENHNDDFVAKDNCKFSAGNSDDLQLYHDGTNSYLNNTGGILHIRNNDVRIQSQGGETMIRGIGDGSVELYHDNSKKIETNSGGADVTGNLNVSNGVDVTGNLTVSGTVNSGATTVTGNVSVTGEIAATSHIDIPDNATIKVGTGDDLQIYHNGTAGYIDSTGNDTLFIRNGTTGGNIKIQGNSGEESIVVNHNGTVDLYFDNSQKFNTASYGVNVIGNMSVTGTVDGRDVAADGSKLDNIENNATADQTASEIVSLVSGQSIAPNDVSASYLYGTSKIGRDSNDYIQWGDNSQMDVYVNGSNEFRFEADGDFHADGDVYAFSTTVSSDENLKKDITIVSDAVTKVEALKGVTFKWKKNDADSAGVIAQDVEKVLPEVVKTVNDMEGNEFKAVNYAGLTSILIEAVKDLSARIKVLEAK
tara:strand:+ start:601 stop:2505 length:1905 start_codon:yes stop_codon:yes gene_type:complete